MDPTTRDLLELEESIIKLDNRADAIYWAVACGSDTPRNLDRKLNKYVRRLNECSHVARRYRITGDEDIPQKRRERQIRWIRDVLQDARAGLDMRRG